MRVMELCYEHMNNPVKVSVTPRQITAEKVQQVLFHVEKARKFSLLLGLLKRESWERVLIFVNTKHVGERITDLLNHQGYTARAITGDIPQKKRLAYLDRFKSGELKILVATDVASRGLHIEGVSIVVNYDLPQDREDYVHRIGRTARAGATGKAIALACEEYVMALEQIEGFIGHKIPVEWAEDALFLPVAPSPRHHRRPAPDRPRRNSGAKPSSHATSSPRTNGSRPGGRPRRRRSGMTGHSRSPSRAS